MKIVPIIAALVLASSAHAQPYGGWPYQSAPQSTSMAPEMASAHNQMRSRVGVPPLAWSEQLSGVAQRWANHLLATGTFSHTPNNRFSENLYMITGARVTASQVVGAWAGEARAYDLRRNTCSAVCGHYTQIVWRATRSVGCAVAADHRTQVWVCEYNPPGNYVGERPY
jgi:pathogenesis-related protein 1